MMCMLRGLGNLISVQHSLLLLVNACNQLGFSNHTVDHFLNAFRDTQLQPANFRIWKIQDDLFVTQDTLKTRPFIRSKCWIFCNLCKWWQPISMPDSQTWSSWMERTCSQTHWPGTRHTLVGALSISSARTILDEDSMEIQRQGRFRTFFQHILVCSWLGIRFAAQCQWAAQMPRCIQCHWPTHHGGALALWQFARKLWTCWRWSYIHLGCGGCRIRHFQMWKEFHHPEGGSTDINFTSSLWPICRSQRWSEGQTDKFDLARAVASANCAIPYYNMVFFVAAAQQVQMNWSWSWNMESDSPMLQIQGPDVPTNTLTRPVFGSPLLNMIISSLCLVGNFFGMKTASAEIWWNLCQLNTWSLSVRSFSSDTCTCSCFDKVSIDIPGMHGWRLNWRDHQMADSSHLERFLTLGSQVVNHHDYVAVHPFSDGRLWAFSFHLSGETTWMKPHSRNSALNTQHRCWFYMLFKVYDWRCSFEESTEDGSSIWAGVYFIGTRPNGWLRQWNALFRRLHCRNFATSPVSQWVHNENSLWRHCVQSVAFPFQSWRNCNPKQIPGAPVNKQKRPKAGEHVNPAKFSIVPNFFQNADGSATPQLQSLRAHSTGLCLMSPSQADSWLRVGQLLSADELGILILGKKPETSIQSQPVTFLAKNADSQLVLLHGHLIQ